MESTDALLAQLQTFGMLLHHDTVLLSLTTLVAGAPVAGSWWSHPRAQQIYALMNTLTDHPDVLSVKFVRGKATFLHRQLWPALLAVACAHDPWQFTRLSDTAQELYEAVERQGTLRATGTVAKELQRRLLVHSAQVHTEQGHHELQLTQWTLWAEQVNCHMPVLAPMGRLQLESAVQAIGGTPRMLPWEARLDVK